MESIKTFYLKNAVFLMGSDIPLHWGTQEDAQSFKESREPRSLSENGKIWIYSILIHVLEKKIFKSWKERKDSFLKCYSDTGLFQTAVKYLLIDIFYYYGSTWKTVGYRLCLVNYSFLEMLKSILWHSPK